MRLQPWRLGFLLSPLLVVVACSSSLGLSRNTQALNERMNLSLARDISAGRATSQPLHYGVRVILVDNALFTPGGSELTEAGRNILISVIQALMNPNLLRINVAETAAAPGSLQAARVQAVTQYFNESGLGPVMQPPVPLQRGAAAPGGAAANGLTITVEVVSN